ncbi:CDGSH iron-sulfur domain-containing protein [Luteolibacter sp. LG18]|uniref:CDGSH iron-sulfur domain-containing protein n=1 Tax=Luteolibacter sp. LG18 TaxID=2819286 RepID=UPI0030C6EBCD
MAEEPAKPFELEVEAGVHWWCACGRSSFPPFCDGSHKGTGMQPVKFEVGQRTTVRWCKCPQTGRALRCVGGESSL